MAAGTAGLALSPAAAGDFAIDWGTAPATWTTGATGPVTITLTDQYGFRLSARMNIARIGGSAYPGYPNDVADFGTDTSLGIAWDPNNRAASVGESTNTATLEFLDGATPVPVDSLSFVISDIDPTDANASDDRCDFVTVTGDAGNPTLSYLQPTASLRSVRIGPGAGSGSTGTLASNQAQCIYNIGAAGSNTSNSDDNGSIVAVFPNGTSLATVIYDESIENVYGVTNRNAAARGIGIWSATAIGVNTTISLTKTTAATRYTAAGQVIAYTYTVTNNGPLPLTSSQNVQIQDDKIGTFTCGAIASDIVAGGTLSCTQNYTVTAADLTAANITNTAVAGVGTGTQSFASRLQSGSAQAAVPNRIIDAVSGNFAASLINGVTGGTTASVFANDTLGAAAFANADVIASITDNGGIAGLSIGSNGTLNVPAGTSSGNYTVTYRICEAALPANCDTATVTLALLPTLRISKTTIGGTGSFTFTGNNGWSSQTLVTTASGAAVTGATQALTATAAQTGITETIASSFFLSGVTCSGLGAGGGYTVNLAGGSVVLNPAAIAAGADIVCDFVNTLAAPQLAVAKTASVASVDARGDTIGYTITVSNTGNVPVSAIAVSDPLGAVTCTTSGTAAIAVLTPSQAETCSLTYTVTQADLDGRGGGDGDIDNTATASGSYASATVSAFGSAAVPLVIAPALAIDKSAAAAAPVSAGDTIVYSYAVTNTGNVTLSGIAVNDVHGGSGPFPTPAFETLTDNAPSGDSSDASPGDGVWSTLAPGDVVTFSATYTVTQTDVNNQ